MMVPGAFPSTDDLPGCRALAKAEWALRCFKRYHEQWDLAGRLVK